MTVTHTAVEIEPPVPQQETGTHRFAYDPEGTSATLAVVTALSEVLDIAPTTLDPIQDTADAEALNALLGGRGDDISVSFSAAEHAITANSDGTITIRAESSELLDDGGEQ
jgi:hypothetical protein